MNILTIRQASILSNKTNRYLRSNKKMEEAKQQRDFDRRELLDFMETLPDEYLRSEDCEKIIKLL